MTPTQKKFISVLKKIAKPHFPFDKDMNYNLLKSEKAHGILKAVHKNFSVIVDERYGFIISNNFNTNYSNNKAIKEKLVSTELIIVSHIDLIKPFNSKKAQNELKKQFTHNNGSILIQGALDNTLTNAILIALMNTKIEDSSNIMCFFSIGEESKSERKFKESKGVKKFVKKFSKTIKDNNIKVINLDVTSDDYHNYYTNNKSFDKDTTAAFIEYDKTLKTDRIEKANYTAVNSLYEFANRDDIKFCYYKDTDTSDDLLDITNKNIWGVSYALSTKNEIHSKYNATTITKINNYTKGLYDLINFLAKNNMLFKLLEIEKKEMFSTEVIVKELQESIKAFTTIFYTGLSDDEVNDIDFKNIYDTFTLKELQACRNEEMDNGSFMNYILENKLNA